MLISIYIFQINDFKTQFNLSVIYLIIYFTNLVSNLFKHLKVTSIKGRMIFKRLSGKQKKKRALFRKI